MVLALFPGQGSQALGMGRELKDNFKSAQEVFDTIDEALGESLTAIMWGDDETQITLTRNAQPALMSVSMAVIKVLEKEFDLAPSQYISLAAGHSLGEYSAYTAAGSFTLEDAARLLRLRGEAMQSAVPVGKGAMAAIIGLDNAKLLKILNDSEVQNLGCAVLANDNSDGQVVISGEVEAVTKAADLAKSAGAKRALMLPVSAPFHSPLMEPAQEKMAEALNKVEISKPLFPILSNVLVEEVSDVELIRKTLVDQVTGQVRWRESMAKMVDIANNAKQNLVSVEFGQGKVLSGLMKRAAKDATILSVQDAKDIENFVEFINNK